MTQQSVQLPTEDELKALLVEKLNKNEITGVQAQEAVAKYKADLEQYGPPLSNDQFNAIDMETEKSSQALFGNIVGSLYGALPGANQQGQDEVIRNIKNDYREGLIQAEKFKMTNPDLAKTLSEINPLEAFFIGTRSGLVDTMRATVGMKTPPAEKQAIQDLKTANNMSNIVGAGQMTGKVAPWVIPGTAAAKITSVPLRAAAATALGAAEGGISARTEDADVGRGAAIGGSFAAAMELAAPIIGRLGGALFKKLTGNAPKAPIVDVSGNYSDEFTTLMSDNNISSADFIDDVQNVASGYGAGDDITSAVAEVAAAIKSGSGRDLQAIASSPQVSPDAVAAAERLGVAGDLPVSVLSTNQKYIELEQGLSSIIGSDISAKQVKAIKEMKRVADETILELGGTTTDSGALSDRVLSAIKTSRDDLQSQSNQAYNAISSAVPPQTAVDDIKPLQDYMRDQLSVVAGQEDKLEGLDKTLIKNLMGTSDKGIIVTYGMIDRERKKIGEQLARKSSPFPDASEAELSRAYSMLTNLQGSVLKSMDADKLPGGDAKPLIDLWDEAKSLVSKRKDIEDGIIANFGKDMEKSIIPTLEAGIYSIDKQGMNKFKKAIDAIPAELRSEAVATALNKVFTAGSRQNELNMGGYADWYKKLSRNETAKKELFKYLPKGGAQRLDDLASISDRFRNALSNKKDTGRVATLFANYDKPNGLIDKIYNLGGNAPDPATRATSMVVRSAMKGGNEVAVVADRMMASEEFKRMVITSFNDPESEAASRRLKELVASKPYNEWVSSLPKKVYSTIISAGLIPWLVSEDAERQTGTQK